MAKNAIVALSRLAGCSPRDFIRGAVGAVAFSCSELQHSAPPTMPSMSELYRVAEATYPGMIPPQVNNTGKSQMPLSLSSGADQANVNDADHVIDEAAREKRRVKNRKKRERQKGNKGKSVENNEETGGQAKEEGVEEPE